MTKDDIAARVRSTLVEFLHKPAEEVTLEASLAALDADSLDVIEITMALEEEFDMEIPDDAADGFKTVADIVTFVVGKLAVTA